MKEMSKLLIDILEVTEEEKDKIENVIKDKGLEFFFTNIDSSNFSNKIKEKVNALKVIIQEKDDRCGK